jgi:DNA-binding transcriptional LysR family regulator
MVNYGQSLPTRPVSFVHRGSNRFAEVSMPGNLTVNNAEAYIAAALAGLGLIQIPALDVRSLLRSGKLVPVLDDLQPPPMQLSLLYARRRNVPMRIAVFHQWVSDLLDRHGVFAKGI